MIPEHYARDVVERCEHLIESLLPVVMGDADRRSSGTARNNILGRYEHADDPSANRANAEARRRPGLGGRRSHG